MPDTTTSNLKDQEIERLAKLAEEASEIVQAAMKIIRFGYESTYTDGIENRTHLEIEIGNLLCIVDYMVSVNDLNSVAIDEARLAHNEKMINNFRKQSC